MGIATPKSMPKVAKASPETKQIYTVPASTGGINALSSLMGMPPQDCLYCHNLMPSEYGMRLRKGFKEWGRGVTGDKQINTIIAFEGQAADSSKDRLWGVTEDGIWDFTVPDQTSPNQDVIFPDQTVGSGWGVWTEFTRDNGDRYLYYADGKNGIHEYSEDTGGWSVPSFQGDMVEADVAFVMSWKNRMWMVEENSGLAWYTDVNSQAGQVTKFVFGSKFEHGGEVKAMYNWTVDGGNGIDDMLVVISRGGDVLIYKGLDPDLPSSDINTLSLVGSYYIGEIPETRRVGVEYGGELYLLSTFGITSVRDLLQGVDPSTPSGPALKISRLIRDSIVAGKDEHNWSVNIHPTDGFMQVTFPYSEPAQAKQLQQNLLTQSWGMWRGVPVNCAETWNDKYYIGDKEGVIWLYDGTLDGVTNNKPSVWTDTVSSVGDGWSQPAPDQYKRDGTQLAESEYAILASEDVEVGTIYQVTYAVQDSSGGKHAMRFGSGTSNFNTGNGTFITTLIGAGAGNIASLVADADFDGLITAVSLQIQGSLGTPIDYDLMTSFQAPNGDHANYKRVGFVRSIGVGSGLGALNVGVIYDYNIQDEITAPQQPQVSGGNLWDNPDALWDLATWDFAVKGISIPFGTDGIGRTVAIAIRGSASTRVNLIGFDVTYTQGGFL